jgi:hypothetical protein
LRCTHDAFCCAIHNIVVGRVASPQQRIFTCTFPLFQLNIRSMPPSATSGRKRSVLLLALSGVVALVFQYGFAPNYDKFGWQYLTDAWTSGCGDDANEELCAGNAGVYRSSAAAFVFFVIFGIGEHHSYTSCSCPIFAKRNVSFTPSLSYLAAKCKPTANREAWLAK